MTMGVDDDGGRDDGGHVTMGVRLEWRLIKP
jgi:hypothetical protein